MTTERHATATEVRAHYKADGHTVRINTVQVLTWNHADDIPDVCDDGHVTFKRDGAGPWLEGRWVSEYRINDECGVYFI
jgi:di/tripeptidase